MALFVTGDLHGRSYISKLERFADTFGADLTRADILLVLGDLCIPWHDPASYEDAELVKELESFPWTTTFIDGNHENHDVLDALPTRRVFGACAGQLAPHVYHLRRGRVYDLAGHTTLTMGGAVSADADVLRRTDAWWPQEVPSDAQRLSCDRAVRRHPRVDIVATHAAPTAQLMAHAADCETEWIADEFNDWLQAHIADRVDFGQWFYGHMHDDRPWEAPYTPLMHVIYDVDSTFPGRLWGPGSLLDDWYPTDPF